MATRVFFLAPIARFDTRSAESFGTVTFLFPDQKDVNPFGGGETLRRISARLHDVGFDAAKDMIALTGSVASMAYFMLVLSGLVESTLRVLIFDAREGGCYRQRVLDLNAMETEA